jgi:hypothetical protein
VALEDAAMTEARVVHASFRKQVSDRNYGTEAAEIYLEDALPASAEDEEVEAVAEALLMQARRLVHAELGRSPSPSVRASVVQPITNSPRPIGIGLPAEPPDEDVEPWR